MKIEKYTPLIEKLFPKGYQLIEGTDDIFELDLALWAVSIDDNLFDLGRQWCERFLKFYHKLC